MSAWQEKYLLRMIRWFLWSFVSLIVIFAIVISLFRSTTPLLHHYKDEVSHWGSHIFHTPIQIQKIEASWHGLKPVVHFSDVALYHDNEAEPFLWLADVEVTIDLFKSLSRRKLISEGILISGSELHLAQSDVGGVLFNSHANKKQYDAALEKGVGWLLMQKRVSAHKLRLSWRDASGKSITFHHVRLTLDNRHNRHRLQVSARVVGSDGHIKFVADGEAKHHSLEKLSGQAYLEVTHLPIASGISEIPSIPASLSDGQVNGKMWLAVNHGAWQRSAGNIQLTDLRNLKVKTHPVALKALSGQWVWQQTAADKWQVDLNQLAFETPEGVWPTSQAHIEMYAPKGHRSKLQYLRVDDVSLPRVATIFKAMKPGSKMAQTLDALQPEGEVREFSYERLHPLEATSSWRIGGRLEHFGVKPYQQFPGVENISGSWQGSDAEGTVYLDSKDGAVEMPTVFTNSLPFTHLKSEIHWQKDGDTWQIKAPQFIFKDADVATQTQLTIVKKKAQPVAVSLLSKASLLTDNIQHLYPDKIMPEKLSHWLGESLSGGHGSTATLAWRGPLHAFPYDHHEGVFEVDAALQHAHLKFATGWPPIRDAVGHLRYHNRKIELSEVAGTTKGIPFEGATADIAPLQKGREPLLTVHGSLSSTAKKALAYVEDSPLKQSVSQSLKGIEIRGPLSMTLDLSMPLEHAQTQTEVNGVLDFTKSAVRLPQWDLTLPDLKGRIDFTKTTLASHDLQAVWDGTPVLLQLRGDEKRTRLDFSGETGTKVIERFAPVLPWQQIQGRSKVKGVLTIPRSQNGKAVTSTLAFDSDLEGVQIRLPFPLEKKSHLRWPSHLVLKIEDDRPHQLTFELNRMMNGHFLFKPAGAGTGFAGGMIQLGEEQGTFPRTEDLLIQGKLAYLNVDAWQQAIDNMSKRTGGLSFKLLDLNLDVLQFKQYHFKKSHFVLAPEDTHWHIYLSNKLLAGDFYVPYNFPQHELKVHMSRFKLDDSHDTAGIASGSIPNMVVAIDELSSQNGKIGHLDFETVSTGKQTALNNIHLYSPVFDVNMHGVLGANKTTLAGKFSSRDVKKAFAQLHLPTNLESRHGEIQFDLSWPGTLMPELKTLAGNLTVSFHDGRILNLGHHTNTRIGVGKLLNVFNLTNLYQKPSLELDEMHKQGFAYKRIHGNFHLQSGVAATTNTIVDGLIAKVGLTGRVNLVSELYDLRMFVTPYLTSSLPVVATLAGGPIVGAVTWAVNRVAAPGIEKMTTNVYRVTGPWHKPNVKEIH